MKTKAAVVHEVGKPIEIEELDLDGPREGEVLIRYLYAGLCHSDLHISQGEMAARLPMVLGHEGAGIVEEVGPGVTRVAPGDHVVPYFLPSCGHCRWCATGQQHICDMGASILEGDLPGGRFPLTGPRGDYGTMALLGTFSQYGVLHQNSVVKVPDDVPLDKACLTSCGVPTGWGSAVYSAKVGPGDTVIVAGCGGIGMNAIQGARHSGALHIIAVDPLENKREFAETVGATVSFSDMDEAAEFARSVTNGNGADKAIITSGIVTEELVTQGFEAIGKGGTLVVTGLSSFEALNIHLPGTILTFYKKTVKGTPCGDCNPEYDIPLLLRMYSAGQLELDRLVTRTYSLEQVNEGYDDLEAGKLIRGVIVHEH